jgi:hypothetical protein
MRTLLYYYFNAASREVLHDYQKILTLSPDDGRIINTVENLGVNTEVLEMIQRQGGTEGGGTHGMSCLAVGKEGKLAYLHASGLLKLYKPVALQLGPVFQLQPPAEGG